MKQLPTHSRECRSVSELLTVRVNNQRLARLCGSAYLSILTVEETTGEVLSFCR